GEIGLPEGPHASRIRGPVHEDHRCARGALRQDTVGPRLDHTQHFKTDETGECLSGMLGARPSESGESVTLGNSTGALVIGVLVLLGHTGDRTPPTPRPTDAPSRPQEARSFDADPAAAGLRSAAAEGAVASARWRSGAGP